MYTADLLQAQHEIKHVWRSNVNMLHGVRIVGFQAPPNKTQRKDMAEGYTNALYNWPTMNWAAMDLSKEWERFYRHCEFAFGGPLSKCTEKEKICNLMSFVGDKGRKIYLTFDW